MAVSAQGGRDQRGLRRTVAATEKGDAWWGRSTGVHRGRIIPFMVEHRRSVPQYSTAHMAVDAVVN